MSLSTFSKVLVAAAGVQTAFALNELGQKCGLAQSGPPYGDCAPGYDCVDQAKYNQFGEVDYYLEYATCERPEGVCVEEQTWWSKPLQRDYLQGKRAIDIVQELREAGWKVNAVLENDGVVNEQPDTRLGISDSDNDPRFTGPGLFAVGSFRVHMSRSFRRDIAKLKIVMEAAWSDNPLQNIVTVEVNSPGRFRGEAIQIQGGQGANSIQTWIVRDIRKGDVLSIKEHISSISLHEISIVCDETPAPSLPPQPEGPKVEVEIFHGCEDGAESETMEFIWAENACQLDQVHDPTEEVQQPESIMFSCVKDGSLWVRQYRNTATCEGQPAAQFFIRHGQEMLMGGGEGQDTQCLKFHLDEIIRNACEIPELTQMPTIELTQMPTVQLTQMPSARPVGPPVKCHSTGDPHFRAFHYEYDNSQIVWRTREQQWFDFQNRGEFSLWETEGLSVHSRHGSRLDFLTTTVSTNNAFAIGGDWMCGETVEIYGYDGYFLRQGSDEWTGKAQVFTSMSQWANRVTCDSVEVHVDVANERIQFTFDQAIVKVELKFYGINIWIDVEGAAYLETDTGICPKSEGWDTELTCDSMFTFYQSGDCSAEPKPTLPPIDVNACDETLKAEAEKRCNACPDVVSPEECVAEVCALNDIAAAAVLLESCDIEDTPIRPRDDVKCQCTGDPHCTWFDGVRQDFQARGEFVLYQNRGVTVMTRQGYRPDVKHADHISTNHGVAIGGAWTCGRVYEFFYDRTMGHADPVRSPEPMLKIGNDEFYGLADITAELTGAGHCARIVNNGNVFEFILAEDAMRVRVQPEWWGINVFVDLDGRFNLPSDYGMCTRKDGSFSHVSCEDTIFTHWDGACETQPWNEIPPEVLVVPACDSALRLEALQVCDACPDIVTVDECLFETCTLGYIEAAHEMVKACLAVPVDPVPVPTPAPKPDVFCWSYNDPHIIHFDGLKSESMDHGHFSLYKTAKFEVQSRQGPNLMFDRSANIQESQSTNNALAISGELICGATLEVEALPDTQKKSFISARIIITKNGETHEFDYESMITEKARIGELTCSDVRVGNGYGGDGHIFRLLKDGYEFMFQARKHGINTKVMVPGDKYLSSDSGVCTKRGDYNGKLECSEILFSAFPSGNCEEEKKNDKDITPPTDVLENCDADLKSEAAQICNQCPNVVSPKECVWETCLLGHIRFAEEQVAACDMDIPKDETCGFAGKLKKKGGKVSMKKFLKSKRSIAPSACKCREACLKSGGTEWMWKSKNGRCLCYENSKMIMRFVKHRMNRKGLVVGSFNGSQAEIIGQTIHTLAKRSSKPTRAPKTPKPSKVKTDRPSKAPRTKRPTPEPTAAEPTPEPTTAQPTPEPTAQFTTEWVKIVGIKDVFTTVFPESAKDTMMVNADNPDADIFMNIGEFDFDDTRYLENGKYTFKMVYGGVNFVDGADNEVVFKQSSKPTETSINGYEWVSGIVDTLEGTTSGLRGVAKNTPGNVSKCLLDGDGDMVSWWNCMAPTGTYYGQGLPAINRRVAKSAALYILNHRA